jgi:hypothetical protein
MSLNTGNFGKPIPVADGSNAQGTKGNTPLGGHTDLQGNEISVPDASSLNQFGRGKGGPSIPNTKYNDSDR